MTKEDESNMADERKPALHPFYRRLSLERKITDVLFRVICS